MNFMDVQCQVCMQTVGLSSSWTNYEGQWRCPHCRAKHNVKTVMAGLTSVILIDRMEMPSINCPDKVRADVEEALAAFNAYAPRAAVVMLRRALERSCVDKGASKGKKLSEMIAELHKSLGVFDEAHVALANATRHFGNYGAHPNNDLLEDLSYEEAKRALDLGFFLISSMYPMVRPVGGERR